MAFRTAPALCVALLASCTDPTPPPAETPTEKKLTVFADSYPVAYFAGVIAGERADVICPVPPGEDPITWFPDDGILQQMQEADLVILNGAGFTKWPGKVTLDENAIVDTAAGFSAEFIHYEDAVTHTHGGDEHTHEGLDGHTWLAPQNMERQAATIFTALERACPSECMKSYANLKEMIGDLDARFLAVTKTLGGRPLLASHPAYNYIAAQYGWKIGNLDLDPGSLPDAGSLAAIREAKTAHPGAAIILWESAPIPETEALLLNELGLESVVFSPCETEPDRDFMAVMRANLTALAGALE